MLIWEYWLFTQRYVYRDQVVVVPKVLSKSLRLMRSMTLPPSATFILETVVSLVTVQVEVPSTLMVKGSSTVEPAEFSVIVAEPVQVEPSNRFKVTEDMVSTSISPFSVWLRPVKFTVAPLEPDWPQLFESLPAAVMSEAASESKSSVVFCSTTFAEVLVK